MSQAIKHHLIVGLPMKHKGSGGSSGRAVSYHVRGPRFEFQSGLSKCFIAPLWPPNTKWVARSLKTRQGKGGEESNGKSPHKAICQEQSGPYC
ncbi:hypothetical protein PoB_004412100 [Plakobranchus ocellatus]|uniref:Uncharacterized protein n=1 Tax=Plakobranchus ocellatus TaxID=259542 RepID=A0AAV4BB20_9GAST|nr:hypothetical protein PoB_004412100 [Plakobranchus ocellatus]